jgi:RNA polymerase subunit RPABC4/transcription elongation factor Spt4
MREGCPNCESTLQLRGNNDAIQECTSQVFEGLIAVRDPAASWVARWQRLDNYVAGTYATKVTGTVSGTSHLGQGWSFSQAPRSSCSTKHRSANKVFRINSFQNTSSTV